MIGSHDGDATEIKLPLLELMAANLLSTGYSVHIDALPEALGGSLWDQSHAMPREVFTSAGIGRESRKSLNKKIRSDEISWIDNSTPAGDCWLIWAAELKRYLNKKLFLGLDTFESHYAIYQPGGFYLRHQDAFRGQANRLLSIVVFLNRNWVDADAGQLVLFTPDQVSDQLVIKPEFGTVVVFLSEEIEHEVLVTTKDRHSIAGWFQARAVV